MLFVSAAIFLIIGAAFVAPYWLYDGAAFLLCFALGRVAIRHWTHGGPYTSYCYATCAIAAISILADLSFIVAARLNWDREMNPFHNSVFGKEGPLGSDQGSSFFWCSTYSCLSNIFVLGHFRSLLKEGPPSPPSKIANVQDVT